jgi:membrane protein YqaA with SNARE-associated domain
MFFLTTKQRTVLFSLTFQQSEHGVKRIWLAYSATPGGGNSFGGTTTYALGRLHAIYIFFSWHI